jgi:hypothetical protein
MQAYFCDTRYRMFHVKLFSNFIKRTIKKAELAGNSASRKNPGTKSG